MKKYLLFSFLLCIYFLPAQNKIGIIPDVFVEAGTNTSFIKTPIDKQHFKQKPVAGFNFNIGINIQFYKSLFISAAYGFKAATVSSVQYYKLVDPISGGEVILSGSKNYRTHSIKLGIAYRFQIKKIMLRPGLGINPAFIKFGNDWAGAAMGSSSYYDSVSNSFLLTSKSYVYPPYYRRNFAINIEASIQVAVKLKFVQPYISICYEQGLLNIELWQEKIQLYQAGNLSSSYEGRFIYRGSNICFHIGANVVIRDIIQIHRKQKPAFVNQLQN